MGNGIFSQARIAGTLLPAVFAIFEQGESDFDDAGNVIETRSRSRHHDATGTGELTTPSGSQPKARVSYFAHYSDALGRQASVANYGTNADTALSRASTVPSRSDTILVSESEYNDDGGASRPRVTRITHGGEVVQRKLRRQVSKQNMLL